MHIKIIYKMKAWCILLIPRHISFLMIIVCSCHMLVLLRRTSVILKNNSYNAQYAPLVVAHYQNKPLNTKIEAQQFPMGMVKDYRAFKRWNLSSFDDIIPPRGEIDGYMGQQQHSNLSAGYKTNVVSFNNVATAQHQASKLQLHQILAPKDLKFVTVPLETKQMQPLKYSNRALKEFYGKFKISAENTNIVSNLNFQYFINPKYICKRSEDSPNGAYLSVMVHSHPANKPQRDAIRNTWGHLAKNYDTLYQMRLVFVLGIANRIEEQDLIWKESKLYRDILQGSFTDLYDNLTVKSLFAIHWVSNFCNDTKYMLKTDDDTYINVSLLINWLRTTNGSHTVIGALNLNAKVMRSGLWQVPFGLFPFDKYPSYCTGCAYVLSTSILRDLLQQAKQVPLIPVEDAYITGILVKLMGHTCYNHKAFPQWYMGPSHLHICNLVKHSLYGVHNVPYYLMYSIYGNMTANSLENCTHDRKNFYKDMTL